MMISDSLNDGKKLIMSAELRILKINQLNASFEKYRE